MAFWVFGHEAATNLPRDPLYLEVATERQARDEATRQGMEVEFVDRAQETLPEAPRTSGASFDRRKDVMDKCEGHPYDQDLKTLTYAGWILTFLSCVVAVVCCTLVTMWISAEEIREFAGRTRPVAAKVYILIVAMSAVMPAGIFFLLGALVLWSCNIRVFGQQE
jgi:hypothetical protein